MNKKLFALASLALTGALILGYAVMSSNRRAATMSADTFELSLNSQNGAITTATYSNEIAYGTGKTTQGNTFRYSYKNAKRYNLKTGSGFAIIKANEGEIVSVDGVSGLLSVTAKVASDSAKLYVSFASSANSASWSDAVEIGSDPIESPQGMDFFKLTAPAGIVYCESMTIRYNCGGISPESSSSEQTSSEDPTSSQETSGEESTSIPGSSESQSSTASSQTSASSSHQGLTTVGTVTFATSGTTTQEISDMAGMYSTDGVSLSGIIATKAFASSDGSVRLASGSYDGSLTLSLAEPKLILGVTVSAKQYNTDNGSLTVATSANQTGQTSSITREDDYYFLYDFIPRETNESNWISLTAPKQKRVYIFSITITMGVSEPVYPTSISLGDDFELGVGQSKKLSVTYEPSDTNVKEVSFQSEDESIATVDANGKVVAKAMGETEIVATATAESGTVNDRVKVTVGEAPVLEKTAMKYNYSDYTTNSCYELSSAPTIDSAKLLVIPVWFTDSTTFISASKKETIREDIRKAYLGTEEETGWNSVKSFYETESAGRLTLDGVVTNWYECGKSYSTYGPSESGGSATESLVTAATNWYFTNNTGASRQDFDRDGNGYLDGVLLIYAAPDYISLENENMSNLWAYCYWLQESGNKNKNNPGPNVFFWASYDFLYDSSTASSKTGGQSSYGYGDNSHCAVDAHTFIHEMGHVFGADDYYDYGSSQAKHAGGFSMQDYNVGGHDPFSVMAFGWADPYIPTDSCEITISAFQKSHDLILLTPEWNDFDSPWDEYFLLELYTPTGLNELDATYSYSGTPKGPSVPGIRLWHVDARLLYLTSEYDSGSYSQLASDVYDSRAKAGILQAFSNTINDQDYGSPLGTAYDKYNLLRLIRNNTSAPIHNKNYIDDGDLFRSGSSFNMSTYKSQFSNSTKMNKDITLDWSFSVSITGTGNDAEATITLVHA